MPVIFNRKAQSETRRLLRTDSTQAEKLFWKVIRGGALGVRFRRQVGIGSYVVDFYVPKLQLVIEIDGSIHDIREIQSNDSERQKNLEALGLTVLRFTNDEILGKLDDVLLQIRSHFRQNPLLTKERAG